MASSSLVCVVVGVGPGIGIAVSRKFALEGYLVVMASRSESNVQKYAKELMSEGLNNIVGMQLDATVPAMVEQFFKDVQQKFGGVDVLVYNAAARRFKAVPTHLVPPEEYHSFWKVNAFGPYLCARAVVPMMLAKETSGKSKGTILFTGATSALRGKAGLASFSVGKFGLRSLAQTLARELGPQLVHVAFVVVDGPVDVPLIRNRASKVLTKVEFGKLEERFIQPRDIAEAYFYLHSQPKSAWTQELDLRSYCEPHANL